MELFIKFMEELGYLPKVPRLGRLIGFTDRYLPETSEYLLRLGVPSEPFRNQYEKECFYAELDSEVAMIVATMRRACQYSNDATLIIKVATGDTWNSDQKYWDLARKSAAPLYRLN